MAAAPPAFADTLAAGQVVAGRPAVDRPAGKPVAACILLESDMDRRLQVDTWPAGKQASWSAAGTFAVAQPLAAAARGSSAAALAAGLARALTIPVAAGRTIAGSVGRDKIHPPRPHRSKNHLFAPSPPTAPVELPEGSGLESPLRLVVSHLAEVPLRPALSEFAG